MLLAIEDPINSIENIKWHLKTFEEVMGLRVNWSKPEFMLANYDNDERRILKEKFDNKLKNSLRYLGIHLTVLGTCKKLLK